MKHNHWRDGIHISDVRRVTARSFCLYCTDSEASDADSCPAAELQLHSKHKVLPTPTDKHYLNFKTSRGQGECLNVRIRTNSERELGVLFKTSTESSYICSAVLKWNNFANKHIFSACSSPWTTLHDTVLRESENKYSLISCNLSRAAGMIEILPECVSGWGRGTGIMCDKPLGLDRFTCNLNQGKSASSVRSVSVRWRDAETWQ